MCTNRIYAAVGLLLLLISYTLGSLVSVKATNETKKWEAVSSGSAGGLKGITKAASYPKETTGLDSNCSVQLLRVFRANVPEVGTNDVVVVQYRLKKEGENAKRPENSVIALNFWFKATDIKLRDPVMGCGYQPITYVKDENPVSSIAEVNCWKTGATGDGYAWFKIPYRVKAVDIFMPFTRPFVHVPIEIPGI